MLDIHQILRLLPHRYPFLLVDRVLEIRPDFIVAVKNVTANEPCFQGHFPELPVMPGVLIIESMAQTGAVLLLSMGGKNGENFDDKLVLFAAIENARFRKPVAPGDQMRIEVKVLKNKGPVWKVEGRVTVENVLVAEATLMCHVVDKKAVDSAGKPTASPSAPEGK
jgi:3-hydroxyacyl-[acyl-carrier-protein] dehydratase